MAINEMRARIALKYEGKTFIEEEDGILVGCQVGQNRTYCSVCDWDECIDRERASFPEEVAPPMSPALMKSPD